MNENLERAAKLNKNIYGRKATAKKCNVIGDKVFYFGFASIKKSYIPDSLAIKIGRNGSRSSLLIN